MCCLSNVTNVQRQLSVAQSYPIVGPLIVSPCKALVSLAQIIGGFISGIFLGIAAVFACGNQWTLERFVESFGHVSLGSLSLGYSIANILTLGIIGWQIENAGFSP